MLPLFWLWLATQQAPEQPPQPPPEASTKSAEPLRLVDLNLLGQIDTESGESRRNENVAFNLIDNNALKELNVRLGATATIIEVFRADHGYFGAEFGNRPQPPLHVPAAKTPGLHASVFETHHNSIFTARSFFQVGAVQPARENHYGFQLTAPVWRGAAVSLDGSEQKIRGSVNGNVLVPRADERTPLAPDPATRAVVARYLAAYPAQFPNRIDINERALNTNAPQRIDSEDARIRLDQRRARDRLTLLYGFTSQQVDAFQLVAGQNPDTDTKSHTARLTWNRSWSAQTISDLSAGFDRARSLLVPEPNAVGPLVLTGMVVEMLGPDETLPINRADNRWRAAGALHHVRGRHYLHGGFEILRRQVNGSEQQAHRGIVFFSSDFGRDALTNMRLGTPSRYQVTLGNPHRGFRNWDLQFYAGDSYHATARLTLDYGLRYQPVTAPYEVNGLSTLPYSCDCNNLGPRFGFAYRLGRQWGVLRGAYGLHYGEIFPVTYQQVRFNPPHSLTVVVPTPYLPDPLRGLQSDGRTSIRLVSPDLVVPYSHQYNFSWEPAVGRHVKLQFGYVGSRSPKLLMLWYTNRARPLAGVSVTSETINQRRPDPRYFDVYRLTNASRGYYDAGKVTLVVPRWRGVSIDVSYWFSKAIDLGSAYTNTAYDKDGRLSRAQFEEPVLQDMKGLSPFDQTHSFLVRVAWRAPRRLGRWEASGVWLEKSGTPFEVQTGSDGPGAGNVDGQNGDRPHLLDPAVLGRTIGHPDTSRALLPRAAFAFIRPGELRGSLGHHVFRKGGIANLNASLSRTFALGADVTLTVRAESINFFNTAQFAEPGRDLTSPSFGYITNTLNDGRAFRFTLRLGF
jgi:hypothetical protein